MDCIHYYEVDLDGKVSCSNCHTLLDELVKDNDDFWSSQQDFEE